MVKSKTKSISNLGAFSNFCKTERSIYNFLKIRAWNWSGSYLFCYGAWAQKESAKLQSMRACTDKLVYPVWNLSDSSKKLDDRQIKRFRRCRQSRFLFPDLSRKDRSDSASDSASRVPHELTCQILTIQSLKIERTASPTCDHRKKRSSPPVFWKNWLNFLVRGQFKIKILIVRGHGDINTTYFVWITGKNKLEPAIISNW